MARILRLAASYIYSIWLLADLCELGGGGWSGEEGEYYSIFMLLRQVGYNLQRQTINHPKTWRSNQSGKRENILDHSKSFRSNTKKVMLLLKFENYFVWFSSIFSSVFHTKWKSCFFCQSREKEEIHLALVQEKFRWNKQNFVPFLARLLPLFHHRRRGRKLSSQSKPKPQLTIQPKPTQPPKLMPIEFTLSLCSTHTQPLESPIANTLTHSPRYAISKEGRDREG